MFFFGSWTQNFTHVVLVKCEQEKNQLRDAASTISNGTFPPEFYNPLRSSYEDQLLVFRHFPSCFIQTHSLLQCNISVKTCNGHGTNVEFYGKCQVVSLTK